MFSASEQCYFDQYTCFGFRRKGLRRIGCTVAMVTTILLKEVAKLAKKIATNVKNTFIIALFLPRQILMNIVYWIKYVSWDTILCCRGNHLKLTF